MASGPAGRLLRRWFPWVGSLVVHGGLAGLLLAAPAAMTGPKAQPPIEITERMLPEPPEPKEPPKPATDPPKPASEPAARAPARTRSRVQPKPEEPPPDPGKTPADEPPPEATGPKTFGIQMEGTARAGSGDGVAVPVGDSLAVSPEIRKRGPKQEGKKEGTGFKKTYGRGEAAPIAVITERPRVKVRIQAEYPERARDLEIEGRVVLELTIDAEGRVTKAKLLDGLHPLLDEAAIEAAKKMLFSPATVNGTPVTVTIRYTFTFILD